MVEEVRRPLAHQMDRVVDDVDEPEALVLDGCVGVAEDQRDVDLAPPKSRSASTGCTSTRLSSIPGYVRASVAAALGTSVLSADWNPASPHPPGLQPDLRGQLVRRRLDPADDLAGSMGEQRSLGGQADAATDALHSLAPVAASKRAR